jgi:hypothetical protein
MNKWKKTYRQEILIVCQEKAMNTLSIIKPLFKSCEKL